MECCTPTPALSNDTAKIALIGNPNVGKSVLFHRLTGHYVNVSNYPGTTVELAQGVARLLPNVTIVDTPGIVAFPSRTEDEHVTARVLLDQAMRMVLQVGDAKNLRRTLLLTVQLAEMGVPLVLALNMMDEAKGRGLAPDHKRLTARLGLPVVPTIATRGDGVDELLKAAGQAVAPSMQIEYPEAVEQALAKIQAFLPISLIRPRALSLMWLSGDRVADQWIRARVDDSCYQTLQAERAAVAGSGDDSAAEAIQRARIDFVGALVADAQKKTEANSAPFAQWLGRMATHPVWGLPVLLVVLYGLYQFIGVFGAGTLVGLFEETLFGQYINPWFTGLVQRAIPVPLISDFLVGEYGLWTVGVTYAAALLLPIVFTFFIAFGMLEDSGYLPRLAVLSNRIFKMLGLNGKAVLPMVLGLGCVTMATMTTRILENKRDRLLVIFLLALAVPCSAQLGVVMGMLAGVSLGAMAIWSGVVLAILFTVGWLAARLLPGERTPLMVELPPLRMPVFSNVLIKTLARLEWYVKEAVPLFLIGTALLFTLDQLNVLPWIIRAMEPVVSGWLGLPAEASSAFLLGFLRRDFAATGLFAMQKAGLLSASQVVVSIVTITLFVPCIASLFMIVKERGSKTALAMAGFIFPLAFVAGGVLRQVLLLIGWGA